MTEAAGGNIRPKHINAVLLVYHRQPHHRWSDADTVAEHIFSLANESAFTFWVANSEPGFPPGLSSLEFDAVVLHYSLFGVGAYQLDNAWREWLANCRSPKFVFFQDEQTNTKQRHQFLESVGADVIFTMLEPPEFEKVYGRVSGISAVHSNLPGYIGGSLLAAANESAKPFASRSIDVGYRGRELPVYLGRGAMEKAFIGTEFLKRSKGRNLSLDINTSEDGRLYGEAWWKFLGDCRAVLGVESGVSAFDIDDEIYRSYSELMSKTGCVELADLREVLDRYENKIFYRTISPRHFEAAAFRNLQILFPGRYSGVLVPMRHYVPLEKDFSNFDEVLAVLADEQLVQEITRAAHEDIVGSGEYTYATLARKVDAALADCDLKPRQRDVDYETVLSALAEGRSRRNQANLISLRQALSRGRLPSALAALQPDTQRRRLKNRVDAIYVRMPLVLIRLLRRVREYLCRKLPIR